MSQDHARWAVAQQAKRSQEQASEMEKERGIGILFGGWLAEMRWKITGPQEEDGKWIRYCGEHGILITKKRDRSQKPHEFHERQVWKESRGLRQFEMENTDEIVFVPKDFMLKCLTMGCLPPP